MTLQSDFTGFVTPEDYLAAEARAGFKSEYYEGEVFAMVGASGAHSMIMLNLAASLVTQLRGKPCRGYSNDTRVVAGNNDKYFYPDMSVACHQPIFQDKAEMVLTNPRLVIEILSPSTEAYDREKKFAAYGEIASLTDYILVAQDRPWVEHFSREDTGRWYYKAEIGLDSALDLPSIECNLALRDVYDRIEFAPQPEPPGQPSDQTPHH